jgi:hypothetical protein
LGKELRILLDGRNVVGHAEYKLLVDLLLNLKDIFLGS